jgi:cyclopropane fatty-acyl-phospholipid synthase-like methyltransferase
MNNRPFAAAAERNKHAILGVLREEFARAVSVLEIGSGTGQHAVYVAGEMPHLTWQTSDVVPNHAGIQAWIDDAAHSNVIAPLELDVLTDAMPGREFDAVFSANTAHIMSFEAVEKMFALVANTLVDRGVFALYGPLRQAGRFNTDSNERFDASLRAQDPAMGIRDLDELDAMGIRGNLVRRRLYAMPANNHVAVWMKDQGAHS